MVGDGLPQRRGLHRADLHRAITRVADATVADDFAARHDALAEHFSREEILQMVGIVINMNVWTRLKVAEGAVPGPAWRAMS
jgi:hypothetical protein